MTAECECPVEHTVAKLGHCRTCPFNGNAGIWKAWPDVPLLPGCPPRHADGTPHDFDWATYSDETQSYGVCRCGYDGMSEALMNLP